MLLSEVSLTVQVDGSHYAIVSVTGLRPGALYVYELHVAEAGKRYPRTTAQFRRVRSQKLETSQFSYGGLGPTFRALPQGGTEPLRVVYGSCRCLEGGQGGGFGEDLFELLAAQLGLDAHERLTRWPHVLLLLGDQIYADNVAPSVVRTIERRARIKPLEALKGRHAHLARARKYDPTFAPKAGTNGIQLQEYWQFAELYRAAWTSSDVPKMLAQIPTYMLADDHEVSDDWNISWGWIDDAHRSDRWRNTVIDGMIATWVYQQWGNADWNADDPRMQAMKEAASSGDDAHRALVDVMERWFAGDRVANYFVIPTEPPIIALDTRSDRVHFEETFPTQQKRWADPRDRIVSQQQLEWLERQIANHRTAIFASSVPLLQGIGIDMLQLAVARPILQPLRDLEVASAENADMYEYFRREFDMDTVSAYPRSWFELAMLVARLHSAVWLAGDVHFSSVHQGPLTVGRQVCQFTHLVSSGFRHEMSVDDFAATVTLADPMRSAGMALSSVRPPAVVWQYIGEQTFTGTMTVAGIPGLEDILTVLDVVSGVVPPVNGDIGLSWVDERFRSDLGGFLRCNTVGLVVVERSGKASVRFGIAPSCVARTYGPSPPLGAGASRPLQWVPEWPP